MRPPERETPTLAARLADKIVRGYQLLISPVLGPRCRFHPTCSEYARESLRRFGFLRGSWLTMRRIVRCQPFCEGGYDPVPAEFSWSGGSAESPE
ncbi:MAG: membrane protein insertion efficiency factor YidD [Gammaproteobacteria bacterium]